MGHWWYDTLLLKQYAFGLIVNLGGTFLGIYNCANQFPVPMQLQPHLFGFLCFVCFAQCLYYGHNKWPLRKIIYLSIAVLIFDIILEYLLINGLQVPLMSSRMSCFCNS